MKHLIAFITFSIFSVNLFAAEPTCHTGSGGYCSYQGPVSNIYVNAANVILIYFDTPIPLELPNVAGYQITQGAAAAYLTTNNPEFAKMLYSTALAAQASGRDINIQMRGVVQGFLQIDRVWLAAP